MAYKLEDFGDEKLLELFPTPDYSFISSTIEVSKAKWIPFEDIHIEETAGNIARIDNEMNTRVKLLKNSFALGIQTNQELGGVQRAERGSPKPFKLLYGFGRTIAQKDLGAKGWAYNIINAGERDLRLVCSVENEEQVPKKHNKEDDIVYVFNGLIKDNFLDNTQSNIQSRLIQYYPRRDKKSITRILGKIMEKSNTPVKYKYYTPSVMKDWRNDNYIGDFAIDGDKDNSKNMYGFTTKPSGMYRTMHRASTKFHETGLKSYVNCYVGFVKEDKLLNTQRINLIQEYIRLRVKYWSIYGRDVEYLILNGFFPQDVEKENKQDFIKVDQSMLDKVIKKCYSYDKKYPGKHPSDIEWGKLFQI
tara:strand:- start:95 stop:1177 length:1083 start_codon:yes stop_codon:yes gene_type:complete